MNENKILDLYNQVNTFGKTLNMNFKVIEKGRVNYFLTVDESHLSTPIAAHGGMLAGLMDATLGVAGLTLVYQEGKVVSTVEFKINYLQPALLGDKLIAEGSVISAGKRILYVEGEIYKIVKGKKELICRGSGTLNAYPAEKAGIL